MEEIKKMNQTSRGGLSPKEYFNMLAERRLEFFTGVPDSLLKDFCARLGRRAAYWSVWCRLLSLFESHGLRGHIQMRNEGGVG